MDDRPSVDPNHVALIVLPLTQDFYGVALSNYGAGDCMETWSPTIFSTHG